jgi:mono/diheme cytochrome c family protein
MQRLAPAAVTLLLGLWACNPSGLPREYADADVPEERLNSAEARERGRVLFLDHCAICHGERADGHGPRRNLSRPAANFADPTWRARMNPRRAYYVIREGLRRTPMPAWKILDEDQTWDLVAYVLSVVEQGPGVAASP